MTRDEIRKKWQNGELVEEQPKETKNQKAQSNQQEVSQEKTMWQKVMQKTDEMSSKTSNVVAGKSKNKNIWQDIKGIGKIIGQSAKKTGWSSLNYYENATLNNFDTYKKHQKEIGEAKYVKENEGKLPVVTVLDKGERKMLGASETPTKDEINKNIDETEGKIQEEVGKQSNRVTGKIAELTPSMTQSVIGMAANAVNPGLGLAFWQSSAGGDYVRQAEQKGMTGKQALAYGTIMGSMESATEWIGGELTKNVGKGAKGLLKAVGKEEIKSKALKTLAAYGLDIGENFLEEAIMEPIEEVVTQATGGEADWSNMGQRMLSSGIDGALTSIIMGAGSMGIGSAAGIVSKAQNGEQITQEDIKKALIDINKSEEFDIEKILQANFNPENLLYNNEVEQQNAKNVDKKMEKVAGEISNSEGKALLQQKKDTDDTEKAETKEAEKKQVEEKIEEKQEEKQEEKSNGNILIKPKLDNELNKERAKNVLNSLKRKEAYKNKTGEKKTSKTKNERLLEAKQQTNQEETKTSKKENTEQIEKTPDGVATEGYNQRSKTTDEIENLLNETDKQKYEGKNKAEEQKTEPKKLEKEKTFIHKKQSERDKLGEGKITGETDESYEVTFEKKDENGNNIVKKYGKERFNEFFDKVGEETSEEKPKEQKLPEIKEEEKTLPKQESVKDNYTPTAAEEADIVSQKIEEAQKRNYTKRLVEASKKAQEYTPEGAEKPNASEVTTKKMTKEELAEYNKKTNKNNKEADDYLNNDYDKFKRNKRYETAYDRPDETTKEYGSGGATLTDDGLSKDMKNSIKESNIKKEQAEAIEALKNDLSSPIEYQNSSDTKIQEAHEKVDDTSKSRRELNQELAKKAEKTNVESFERKEETNKENIANPNIKENVQEETTKQTNTEPTTEELNEMSRQRRNERIQKNKETWQETKDRETREHFDLDEEYWDDLTENEKWVYRNKFNNSSVKNVENDIRNKAADRVEKIFNESKPQVDENLENDEDYIPPESNMTAKDLWEAYKEEEMKLNNKNDDLSFQLFNGNKISSNEENFDSYLNLAKPEQFIKDLKQAIKEKGNSDFKETYGITESVFRKGENIKDEILNSAVKSIADALAINDDNTKLKTLDELGDNTTLNKEDFEHNFNRKRKAPGSLNTEYTRYLDEKLRRLYYDKVNEKYDLGDEFTQKETRRIVSREQEHKLHRDLSDHYEGLVDSLFRKIKETTGRDMKPTDFKEKKTINPNSAFAKLKGVTQSIKYLINTPERVNEYAFDRKTADAVNKGVFDPLKNHLTDMVRFTNDVSKVLKGTGIKDGTEDSKLLYWLIEGKRRNADGREAGGFNNETLLNEVGGDTARANRIIEAAEVSRNLLDNILERANEVRKAMGLKPIARREHYISHSFNKMNDNLGEYFAELIGTEGQEAKGEEILKLFKSLDSSIANTENNEINNEGKPNDILKTRYEKSRTGDLTSEMDAIKTIALYADNMAKIIYLTEDVQRLTSFEKLLRQTAQLETANYDNNIYDFDNLSTDEQIQREYLRLTGAFRDYTNWLHSYINTLVGKQKEVNTGVPLLNTAINGISESINKLSSRLGANAVSWNFKTPFTNFIPAMKTIAQSNPIATMKAIGQMAANHLGIANDGFLENSGTWTRRQGTDWDLQKSLGRKIADDGMYLMNKADDVATEFILRAKYNESLANYEKKAKRDGTLTQADELRNKAMYYADDFASRMLAERTLGRTPLAFSSGVLRPLTQFQIEPTNEAVGYLHDMKERWHKDQEEFGISKARSTANIAASGVNMILLSQLFNNAFEAAFGSRPTIDLMQVIKMALGYEDVDDDDENKDFIEMMKSAFGFNVEKNDKSTLKNLGEAKDELLSYVPIVSQFYGSNARIPTAGAVGDIAGGITDILKATEAENPEEMKKGMLLGAHKAGYNATKNFILPAGGIQADRTFKAAKTFYKGGDYNDKGELRFPVQDQDKTPVRQAQALLFGKNNLPTGKEYARRGKKDNKWALSENDTELYNSLDDVSYKDFTSVIDTPAKDKEQRMNQLDSINASIDDKWKIFKDKLLNKDQVERANKLLDSNLITKEQYMDKYEEYQDMDVNMPSEKDIEKMEKDNISFDLLSKYKEDVNNMKQEQEKIRNTTLLLTGEDISKEEGFESTKSENSDISKKAKLEIIKNDKYTDEDREKIFKDYIIEGANINKQKKNYEDFKMLGTGEASEINKYIAWQESGLSGNSGKKDEVLAWIKSHNLTEDQKAFIMSKKQYKLTGDQKRLLESKGVELSKRYK